MFVDGGPDTSPTHTYLLNKNRVHSKSELRNLLFSPGPRISKKNSNLIKSFGGHAMAAGLTIEETNFDLFVTIFEQTCTELLTEDDLKELKRILEEKRKQFPD